jgi:hypothetical protein
MVTTIQRQQPATALVEPEAPMWAKRMVLKFLDFFMPIDFRRPLPVWACKKADLPLASDYPNCVVVVSDQNELALSVGGSWLKVTMGGPV